LLSLTRALGREQTELLKAEWGTRRGGPTHDDSGAGLASTSAGARALFCTLAGLTYRQLCGLVQRPSETGAVIAHIGRCWSGDKANSGTVHDPELFRREILPRLGSVKLSEIAEAAGCSKAPASDIRRGKWTPHVSTWKALGRFVSLEILDSAKPSADGSCMDVHR